MQKITRWLKAIAIFAIFWFVFTGLGVALMAAATSEDAAPNGAWSLVIVILPLVGAFYAARRFSGPSRKQIEADRADREAARWEIRQHLHEQVDKHRSALQRNVRNALVKNDYDVIINDKRAEAIVEFLASVGFSEGPLTWQEAIDEVLADLEGAAQQRQSEGFDPTLVPVDGHEFEHWVAESLRKFGWDASVTSASGDQGIDVIASKNGLRLGIQCKLYSQAVGNKAIQEALAGARYHGLHRAAVLSNATFTKSAMNLAAAADVLLISQYDLPELEDLTSWRFVPQRHRTN